MSLCIEKLRHDCGSKDGLQVFQDNEGKYTGYCFACDTYVADPYADGEREPPKREKKTEEQIKYELAEISTYETHALPDRKLKKEYLEYFGIKVGVSEADGVTPAFHYYPYERDGELTAYRVRLVEGKRIWSVGDMKGGVDLFGWRQAIATGAKSLYITEGEPDAVALFQALKEKQKGTEYEKYDPAVVSLTKGSSAAKADLLRHMSDIRRLFKRVVLVFDMDEPGDKAKHEALSVYPTAETAILPAKDANDCVIQGRSLALARAVLFNTATPKNTRIVVGTDLIEAAAEEAKWGIDWPWRKLTEMTRGIRYGETIYIGAGVKMGKSTVVDTLAADLMVNHGLKVFMAKPEEANKKTMKLIASKVAGKVFTDPKVPFDRDAYFEAAGKFADKLHMVNLYQHLGWESLKPDILQAAHLGCKAVFIDPITNLTNGIAAADANTRLQEVAQELSAMALDLDIVIFIFCHLKAPEFGPPHENGGQVFSSQFAGSRAMMRSCNYMLALEGNKSLYDKDGNERPIEQRNLRKLRLLEDREFGEVGAVPLYYDYKTGLLNELKEK